MQLIYNILDGLAAMSLPKRIFASWGLFLLVSALLGTIYFLFRTYNFIGLGVLLFISQILLPRDSIIERMEMKKIKKQEEEKTNQQVHLNV